MGAQVTDEAMWPAILEKAVAQRMGGYDIMEQGRNPALAMKWLTGHSGEEFTQSSMPSVKSISDGLRRGGLMAVGFHKDLRLSDFVGAEKRGFETGHAYAVVAADPVKRAVTLANSQIRDVRTITFTQDELRKSRIFLFRAATK